MASSQPFQELTVHLTAPEAKGQQTLVFRAATIAFLATLPVWGPLLLLLLFFLSFLLLPAVFALLSIVGLHNTAMALRHLRKCQHKPESSGSTEPKRSGDLQN